MGKNNKTVLLFLALCLSGIIQAQNVIEIKSSVICGMCKDRIEKELGYMKGIQAVQVNLSEKTIRIQYKGKRLTPEAIRARITEIGYDADEKKADADAYDALPKCCRKETTHH
jgi:periplasmic mercuric ion binding protein